MMFGVRLTSDRGTQLAFDRESSGSQRWVAAPRRLAKGGASTLQDKPELGPSQQEQQKPKKEAVADPAVIADQIWRTPPYETEYKPQYHQGPEKNADRHRTFPFIKTNETPADAPNTLVPRRAVGLFVREAMFHQCADAIFGLFELGPKNPLAMDR